MLSPNKAEAESMISDVAPPTIVLGFSPWSCWVGTGINGHHRWKEECTLSIELVPGYPGLFNLIA